MGWNRFHAGDYRQERNGQGKRTKDRPQLGHRACDGATTQSSQIAVYSPTR
jgi:hypothetical protein